MIVFKTLRQRQEFNSPLLDKRLKIILYCLAGYMEYILSQPLIITGIFRTQEEQDSIYEDNFAYKQNPWTSVHQVWRGADTSVLYLTKEQIDDIVVFLNDNFKYSSPRFSTSKAHNVGFGSHIHIQCDPDKITEIGNA